MGSFRPPEVTEALLVGLVARLVESFDPEKIILFGSWVWGVPERDSDVDLLVILESKLPPARRSAELSLACRPRGWAVDFVVKTPDEVDRRLQIGDPFLRRILDQGRVMYAR